MSGNGDAQLIAAAVEELYGLDPAGFTQRRNALATAARKSGDADAAKQITALRRPTRAAWILNQLARADAGLAGDFGALGEQLREAHLALDGAQIRDLTRQRRLLIDQTTAQAFEVAGVTAPTAALRDDVTATLGAVLADPAVAWRFAAGILVAAEDQSGFGPTGAQLSAVPTLVEPAAAQPTKVARTANPAGAKSAGGPAPARPSAREARERERRQVALAKAEAALEQAQAHATATAQAAAAASEAVRQLTDQLADATRREDDALLDARHAELQLGQAEQAVARLARPS